MSFTTINKVERSFAAKLLWILVAALMAAAWALSVGAQDSGKASDAETTTAPPTQNADDAERRPVTDEAAPTAAPTAAPNPPPVADLTLRGILIPKREVVLTSLRADRVTKVNVVEGQRVTAGQTLVAFACEEAQAEAAIATARLKQFELVHASNRELLDEDAITLLDFSLSEARVEEGEAELSFARARVKKCTLTAPYDAVVVELAVKEFANAQLGEPLVALVDDRSYELVVNVPSPWIKWRDVYQDSEFTVHIDETGKRYPAVVRRIGALIDATSRTVELTADVIGVHEELAPGMTGDTDIAPPAEYQPSAQ